MTMHDKIIAGIMLVYGAFGILWISWAASQVGFPVAFLAANMVLAAIGVAAGIGSLKRRRWAVYLGIAFFLLQLVHVITPIFQWSLTIGFNLNISLGWLSSGELGLNLFAWAMAVWSNARAFAPGNSFKPNRLRGSA